MFEKLRGYAVDAAACLTVLGVVAFLIYFIFFRDAVIAKETRAKSNSAFQNYIDSPTLEGVQFALREFTDCAMQLGSDNCDFPQQTELVKRLIANEHIDLVLEDNFLVIIFNFDYSKGMIGSINAQAMSGYKNNRSDGLIMKADALVRLGKIKEAMSIYKSLFKAGYQTGVARSLRSLFQFYGCATDVQAWGEFTNEEPSLPIHPQGTPYPVQPAASEEIIDRRIRLRRGEFVPMSLDCPLNKILAVD